MIYNQSAFWSFFFFMLVFGLFGAQSMADAAELRLTWNDNSTDETGFNIERRVSSSGTYQQVANVQANVTSYADPNVSYNTTYCYRVRAYNSSSFSGYSNEFCAMAPAATFTVSVSRSGTGSGTVTSSPAGITCGNDCSEIYAMDTSVTLTASAAAGSTFAGWTGNADCADGHVTVNLDIGCTAVFSLAPAAYTLTMSVAREATSSGSGDGRIVSNPVGIDCGTDCTETYSSGTAVTLTPLAAANSKFMGWSGNSDCSDGSVTMNTNKGCTATFALNAVTLSVARDGSGTVMSTPSGIDCGTSCSHNFVVGNNVTLQAVADSGFVFTGWSGAGCTGTANCNVSLSSSTVVTANFIADRSDRIGIYRPSTGEWFLDRNGNGSWDECEIDLCIQTFAGTMGSPVVGDWTGSGSTKVGLFVSNSSGWRLDANGNGKWDGCGADICVASFGEMSDIPVVGQWTSTGQDRIGAFRLKQKKWLLDINGDGMFKNCKFDRCFQLSNYTHGDLPVIGDWTGHGKSQLGLFRPRTGEWFLDGNGNGAWNGCSTDICVSSFGSSDDLAVSGDWNGSGLSKIGVFRPATGEWFLDFNGNGRWDGCEIDKCLSGYGDDGDIPVVGKW
ncbi:MAG: hypothetical protein GEU77_07535 [Deltaproteobacteria bacterium]|nr:hypothetical protein [Deltaproteobacteria bacterium]